MSTASLSSMNSFALGLLLGGLRGPLVMILWTDSENQKTEKNLEGVDTEIEWIRLLQPEFDTVHLFQIWNKAYNISVQMASMANKYDTILGALDYAHNVDAQKPDDINIVAAIGQLYFDKLGTSSEKVYYRRRVREESKPHATESAERRADVGWRRVTLDPVLGRDFGLLPSPAVQSDLRVLAEPRYAKYGPYTDGLNTFGFAFNYYKRADDLLVDANQHHDQLSDVVIDSRPALTLKNWGDTEVDQARMREAQAFGRASAKDDEADAFMSTVTDPDLVTADVPPAATPARPADVALAEADYDRATKLLPDGLAEYARHIKRFPDRFQQYALYMSEMVAEAQVAAADRDYLLATAAPAGADRDRLLSRALDEYVRGEVGYDLVLLRYNTDGSVLARALPPGFAVLPRPGQQPLEAMAPEQVVRAEAVADQAYAGAKDDDPNSDRFEYLRHLYRIRTRVGVIAAALGTRVNAAATVPDDRAVSGRWSSTLSTRPRPH